MKNIKLLLKHTHPGNVFLQIGVVAFWEFLWGSLSAAEFAFRFKASGGDLLYMCIALVKYFGRKGFGHRSWRINSICTTVIASSSSSFEGTFEGIFDGPLEATFDDTDADVDAGTFDSDAVAFSIGESERFDDTDAGADTFDTDVVAVPIEGSELLGCSISFCSNESSPFSK